MAPGHHPQQDATATPDRSLTMFDPDEVEILQQPATIMTRAEWLSVPAASRTTFNGRQYLMLTALRPVMVVPDEPPPLPGVHPYRQTGAAQET